MGTVFNVGSVFHVRLDQSELNYARTNRNAVVSNLYKQLVALEQKADLAYSKGTQDLMVFGILSPQRIASKKIEERLAKEVIEFEKKMKAAVAELDAHIETIERRLGIST